MAKLILKTEGKPDKEYRIEGKITIGRRATNDIVLTDNACSREHAEIVEADGAYKIRDMGSHNGTLLNGIKISETFLKDDDVVSIGKVNLLFKKAGIDDLLGKRISGYTILEKLGEGGMGKVYKAHQISMDRDVALKVLSEKVTKDESYIKAFILEARVAGKLTHPNVVSVHDFGKTEDGTYYLSMEYVSGKNVREILDEKGKLSPEESVAIISQIAVSLDFAHRHEIVHSDIKPQNILVNENGMVKLADLGLAKYYGKGSFDSDPDVVMGTPFYMSPEQATKSTVGPPSDIYSLGATFFHMITGRPPFDGESALAVLTKHVTEPVPSPRKYDITISPQISNLIKWMMEKNPEDRPADVKELQAKLEEIKNQEQNQSARVVARKGYAADVKRSMVSRRKRKARQGTASKVLAIAVGLIGVFIIIKLLLAVSSAKQQQATRPNNSTGTHQQIFTPGMTTQHNSTNTGIQPASNTDQDDPAVKRPPPSDRGIQCEFTNMSDKDRFVPLTGSTWSGWNFDYISGFLESPGGDTVSGFEYLSGLFSSHSFAADLSVEFLGNAGTLSFYLEDSTGSRTSGFHFNADEVILFTPGREQNFPFKRKSGTELRIRLYSGSEKQMVLLVGIKEVGRIDLTSQEFKGRPVVKIDGLKVKFHTFKAGRL